MRAKRYGWVVAALAVAVLVQSAEARIKLATLPVRSRVEIQLDNASATLVEEERVVTLLKGTNQIDFSWSNTQIDKYTILFRPLEVGDTVRVIHVAYPPGENALVWQVFADKAGPVRVRISYLIGNLNRTFSYRATAEFDESSLTLRNYIRVWNFSGEEFGPSGVWAGIGQYFRKEMGLQESKEMLLEKFLKVPIKKQFIFNWRTGQPVPDEPFQKYVTMHYVLKNDEANQLGKFPLPYGKVRIFQKDGHGGEAFTGEDWGKFTPIDDEMKLYLGLARDVKVERTVKRNKNHSVHGNLYHQEVIVQYKVQNFKKDAAVLDIEEDMNVLRDEFCGGKKDRDAQWELAGETTDKGKVERKSAQKVEIHIPLPAAPKEADKKPDEVVFLLHLFFRNEW
ncbi:MAG TPA: hypothetical protein VFH53_04470 [Phycisphaerae bacterium]|nr:hypothetical protein [Phycisphaerae bacterium]